MQCIWSTVTYKIRGYIKKPHKQYPFQAEIPKSLDRLDAGGVSISNALFGLDKIRYFVRTLLATLYVHER